MGFDDTDDDIDSAAPFGLGGFQHLEGFADAGRCAQENLQPPARFLRRLLKQGVG